MTENKEKVDEKDSNNLSFQSPPQGPENSENFGNGFASSGGPASTPPPAPIGALTSPTDGEAFLSLAEASRQTGYHQDYLGFLCRAGKLRGFKIGRNWVTTKDALSEFLKTYKNGVSEVTDETGAKIQVHVLPAQIPNDKFQIRDSSLQQPQERADVILGDFSNGTPPENLTQGQNNGPVHQSPNQILGLSNLKKEVFEDLENRIQGLSQSLEKIEKADFPSTEKVEPHVGEKSVYAIPAVLPEASPRPGLSQNFVSNFDLSSEPNDGTGKKQVAATGLFLAADKVKQLYKSFTNPRPSSLPIILATSAIVLAGLVGSYLWTSFGRNNQAENETKIVYQKSVNQPVSQLADQQTRATGQTGTEIINQLLGLNQSQVYSLIDQRLNQYLAEGKFKGPKGDNGQNGAPGPVGPQGSSVLAGGYNPFNSYPPAPANNFSGGTSFGTTDLSAHSAVIDSLQAGQLTVTGGSTFNGGATFNSNAAFNGTTTISNLSVTGLNPGFSQGSVVFQGVGGLAQDNANLFYNASTTALGIGTSTPGQTLTVSGNGLFTGSLSVLGTTNFGSVSLASSTIGTLLVTNSASLPTTSVLNLTVTAASTLATTSVSALTASGNLTFSTLTPGSILFAGTGGLLNQNNSNFFWDNTNKYFNLGTNTVASTLAIQGSGAANPFSVASSTGASLVIITSAGNVGIGSTSPVATLGVVGTFNLTGAANLLSSFTVSGQTSVQNASSTALTVSGPLVVTATSTLASTTIAGNLSVNANQVFVNQATGNVGIGTTSPSSFKLQIQGDAGPDRDLTYNLGSPSLRWNNIYSSTVNGTNLAATGTTTLATTTVTDLTVTGNASIGNNLTVNGGSITLGNSTTTSLTVNASINSSLVPSVNNMFDIGSPSFFWRNGYFNNINVNSISAASSSIAGTQSNDFTINTDNGTADTETMNLIFFRGTVVPNALMTWNSVTKRFEFNQAGFFQNASNSTTETTLLVKGNSSQTADVFQVASSSGSNLFTVQPSGNVTIATMTQGSVLFAGAGGLINQNNSNFFWDNTNNRLGIGVSSPQAALDISQSAAALALKISQSTNSDVISVTKGAGNGNLLTATFSSAQANGLAFTNTDASSFLQNSSVTGVSSVINVGTDNTSIQAGNFVANQTRTSSGSNPDLAIGVDAYASSSITTAGTWGYAGRFTAKSANIIPILAKGFAGQTADLFQVQNSAATLLFNVTSAGNVGIGTTSPAAALNVLSTTSPQLRISYDSSNYATLGVSSAGQLTLDQTNGGNIVFNKGIRLSNSAGDITLSGSTLTVGGASTIVSENLLNVTGSGNSYVAGNLGVGTTTPSARLSVTGTSAIDPFDISSTSGTSLVHVTQAGNVGIGTNNPQYNLDLTSSGQMNAGVVISPRLINGSNPTIGIQNSRLEIGSGQNIVWANQSTINGATMDLGLSRNAAGVLEVNNGSAGTWRDLIVRNYSANTTSTSTVLTVQGLAGKDIVDISSSTGASLFHITQAGNVGIGTSSPSAALNLYSSTEQTFGQFINEDNVGANAVAQIKFQAGLSNRTAQINYYSSSAATFPSALELNSNTNQTIDNTGSIILNSINRGSIVLRTSNTERMRISEAGNLGIGTTTPSARLSLTGTSAIDPFDISSTSGTSLVHVTQAGNVGIGTTSPTATFHVASSNTNVATFQSTSAQNPTITLQGTDRSSTISTAANGVGISVIGMTIARDAGQSNAGLIFNSSNNATTYGSLAPNSNADLVLTQNNSAKNILLSGGNVGIGTSTPAQLLSVAGNMRLTGALFDANNASGTLGMLLQSTATGTQWVATSTLGISSGSGVTGGQNGFVPFFTSATSLGTSTILSNGTVAGINATSSTLSFNIQGNAGSADILNVASSSGTSNLYVTNAGNVGIGTTTPQQKLHVVGITQLTPTVDSTVLSVTNTLGQSVLTVTTSVSANPTALGLTTNYTGSGTTVGQRMILITGSFAPANDTPFTGLSFQPTLNAAFAVSKVSRGLLISPTLTAIADFRSIETSAYIQVLATGTNISTATDVLFNAPTITSASSSQYSLTNAYTLNITGAPNGTAASTTIASSTALAIQSNALTNVTNGIGLYVSAPTGATNNYAAIFASGNVGVGSTAPTTVLAVKGTGTVDPFDVSSSSNTSILRVTSSGNVGVGTTSPSTSLFVQGTGGVNPFAVASSTGSQLLTITQAGNVGIGTSTPGAPLDIYAAAPAIFLTQTSQGTAFRTVLGNQANNGRGVLILGNNGPNDIRFGNSATGGSGNFFVNNTAGYTSSSDGILAMTMLSSGNVGIGSATPNTQLSVKGSGTVDPFDVSSSSNSSILRVTGGGNVGIGTTTPIAKLAVTTAANGSQIQFGGTGYLSSFTNGAITNESIISNEAFLNSNGTWTAKAPSSTIIDLGVGNGGNMGFFTDSGLTVGNTFTPTQRMTLTTAGNLGIGTTTPNALFTLQPAASSGNMLWNIASTTGASMVMVSGYGGFVQNISSSTAINIMDGSTTPSQVFVVDTTQNSNNAGMDITAGGAQTGNLLNFFSSGGTQMLAVTSVGGISQNISSTTALQIQNGSGVQIFAVNTVNGVVNFATSASTSIATIINTDGNFTIGDDGLTGTTDGRIWLKSRGKLFRFLSTDNTADYSEFFYQQATTSQDVGTIMTVDNSTDTPVADSGMVRQATTSYDSNLVGAVTDKGTSYNNPNDDRQFGGHYVNVGMLGHIKVKLTDENGAIQPGDYLTSSKLFPGYAMKATRSGYVIGQALVSFPQADDLAALAAPKTAATSTASSTLDSVIDSVATSSADTALSQPSPANPATSAPIVHKGHALTFVSPHYQIVNNTFVLGENDGQLSSATSTPNAALSNAFLIDQKGSGNILQLQANDQDRFLVATTGSVSILANSTSTTQNILTVVNASTTLFTINSVGDAAFVGHISVGADTAGTATIKAGDNEASVTFASPYLSVPKIVVTAQGVPNFFYGVINKTGTGFTIAADRTLTADMNFDWVALAQPLDTASQSSLDLSVVTTPGAQPPINPTPAPAPAPTPAPTPTPPPDTGSSTPNGGQVAGTSTSPSNVTPAPAPSPLPTPDPTPTPAPAPTPSPAPDAAPTPSPDPTTPPPVSDSSPTP